MQGLSKKDSITVVVCMIGIFSVLAMMIVACALLQTDEPNTATPIYYNHGQEGK
jgi:hypothetical protein